MASAAATDSGSGGTGGGAGAAGVETSAAEVHMTSGFWFIEEVTPELATRAKLNKITFDTTSKFQKVQIVETGPFGKTLVLDGKTQSAIADEHVYHESLVHPAMLAHPNPETVFIGGGGEYATAREVLRHKSVKKCIMVDIDEIVCNVCEEQMPEWSQGATKDPRLEVRFEDAKAYIDSYEGKFDVIIMDIADPIEAGPGIALYTLEFYKTAITKLNPGGVLVTQSGPGSVMNIDECCTCIHQTLASAFDHVLLSSADIPSFGCNWAYNMAFNKDNMWAKAAAEAGKSPFHYVLERSVSEMDKAIADRLTSPLRFLDGVTFKGLFGTPKPVRDACAAEKRIMTKDNPVFMY